MRVLSRLLFPVSIALLAGCASTPQTAVRSLANQEEGAVIVRLLPNVQSATMSMRNWDNLVVQQDSEAPGQPGRLFALKPDMTGSARSATFAGALPAGSYHFTEFTSQTCGTMCSQAKITVNDQFSHFDVRAGQLTDLGVIVQTPGRETKKVALAHVNADDPALTDELVRAEAPQLAAMLARPHLGWRAGSIPADMPALARYAKSQSAGFVEPTEATPGFFIYGTANGVIGGWSPAQNKSVAFDLGTSRSIESILVTSSGAWIAGGELSLLKQSDDQGKTWRSIRGNLPLGLIFGLHEWHGEIFATMGRFNQVSVFALDPGATTWRLLQQQDLAFTYFSGDIRGVAARTFLIEDQLVTLAPSRKLVVTDLVTETTAVRELPGGVQRLSWSEDKVLRCKCTSGIAVQPFESHDMGQTWARSELPRFIQQPVFRHDGVHGVAYEYAVLSSPQLVRTEDGGKTWTPTLNMASSITRMFYTRDETAVYAATPYGNVWESKDDGKTWRHLR